MYCRLYTIYRKVNFCQFSSYIYCMPAYSRIKRRKKMSVKAKFRTALFVVLAIMIALVFYYLRVVCPIVVGLSEEKIRSVATRAVSEVVGDVLSEEGVSYNNLVKISYAENNKIDLIELDTVEVNLLIRKITQGVQDNFDILGHEGIEIALGTFTGIPFLYGLGPNVAVQLVPVGTVSTKIVSKFLSAGINQTLHQVNFEITTGIGMVLPAKTQNFNTMLEVLICESVLVGDVPSVYLQNGLI